ncbi:ABC transporter ATP-binding protein/permease [Halorussus salilacus]|uniref:ABC transporter ATP-binding protein n=1 Tax=Halorussus salilacus TaxID=2953750 RepID=UPI0020A1A468|nr:ABC transporter ATP-binding protein [Halorussus salilacus]USZ67221.1 ABC transporter ATP-binding protein/permease [Halorussus salilacus]
MRETDISRREKLRGLYRVATYRPALTAFIVAFSVFAAVLEGVGISFIVPIVEVARAPGDPAETADGYALAFVRLYETLGVPFTIGTLVAGVAGVMVARFTSSFVVSWLQVALKTYYVRHLQTESFGNALDARVAYFDREGSDDVLNAIVTQAEYAGKVIRDFVDFFQQLLLCLMYLGIALYLSWELTLVSAAFLGGLTYVFRHVLEPGYTIGDRVAEANERIQESVQAGTQAVRDVKLFTMGEELFSGFSTHIDTYTESSVALGRNEAAIDNFYNLLTAVMVFALIYGAITFTGMGLSELGVFLFAMFQLGPRVSSMNYRFYKFEGRLPHLVRTQTFIAELKRNREPTGGSRPVPEDPTPVAFEDVSFAYETEEGRVLRDVSFEVGDEEFVAFVGQSGAGKSTVAALLARLYEPDEGSVTAAGEPIEEFDVREWRERVAVVRQDPFIFNETVEYNVTVGNRDASRDEIDRVCEIAQVTEFLDDLPAGYDTELGDDGVRLSGGQRQRIALARALLKDADVLVLDEATSDLDTRIEADVQREIESMDREYAIVAIAHRLSTVRGADRIYALEDGRITEQGDHDELVDEDGTYADLYATQ